jgi:methyl-accepting chemotaxis protein-1 (serine sensor receptor)
MGRLARLQQVFVLVPVLLVVIAIAVWFGMSRWVISTAASAYCPYQYSGRR